MVIYKYELTEPKMKISAPFVKILDIQYQNGIPTLWAIVNPNLADTEIEVTVVGTGWEFDNIPGEYVKTLQNDMGFVWHFFIKEEGVDLSALIKYIFKNGEQVATMS